MRIRVLGFGVLAGLLAGCTAAPQGQHGTATVANASDAGVEQVAQAQRKRSDASIANAPDQGALVAYDRKSPNVRRDGMVYHPASLSEEHALRAIGAGKLELTAPDGEAISVAYARTVEHDDGNWSWVGRDPKTGANDTLITFGEKAVFGTITRRDGRQLQVTTMGGRTYVVEADPNIANRAPNPETTGVDSLAMPVMAQVTEAMEKAKVAAAASKGKVKYTDTGMRMEAATASTITVDVLIGYTGGFRTQLGGDSQAATRINNMIDVANDAFVQSQVDAQLHLVHAMAIDYPDATANRTALMELSALTCANSNQTNRTLPTGGVTCDPATRPASLQSLVNARETYGADLVALVRPLRMPQQQSCGIAWMLGGAQQPFTSASDDFAYSVVSDSVGTSFPSNGSTCRNESLIHELGHNMGLQHDVQTAMGGSGTLEPDEFGHHPFSFGFSTDASNGNFVDVMGVRGAGQLAFRVFSNPDVTLCGGRACGIADEADTARSLRASLSTIAAFRANFGDVPSSYWAYDAVRRVYLAGITTGCSVNPAMYCPTSPVTRDQMAIFMLRGIHGGGFQPPAVATSSFADVPNGFWALPWIEQLVAESITGGCGVNPARYCPGAAVTRAQMAVFLLRARHGAAYIPPPASGQFSDVGANYWAAAWIEQLAAEGVTGGCATSPARFCPESPVTRDQMAVFMVRAFSL